MAARITTAREHDDRVLRVRLAAPKANILDSAMVAEIEALLPGPAADPRLALMVLEGEGEHFSFGASVAEHKKGEVERMLPSFHRFFRRLAAAGVPLAALVRGNCLGGGLELAAFCDFVLLDEGAKLGFPEIKLAVFPPVGTALLPSRMGVARAADWVLTGSTHPAAEALAAGLATRMSARGQLEADFQAWLPEAILAHSASSLRLAVRALRSTWQDGFFAQLDRLERLYLDELMATKDAAEGIDAFLQKRRPVWSHGKAS